MKTQALQYPATVLQIAMLLGIRHEQHDRTLSVILALYKDLAKNLPDVHPDKIFCILASEIALDSYGKDLSPESTRILVNSLDMYKGLLAKTSKLKLSKAVTRAFGKR